MIACAGEKRPTEFTSKAGSGHVGHRVTGASPSSFSLRVRGSTFSRRPCWDSRTSSRRSWTRSRASSARSGRTAFHSWRTPGRGASRWPTPPSTVEPRRCGCGVEGHTLGGGEQAEVPGRVRFQTTRPQVGVPAQQGGPTGRRSSGGRKPFKRSHHPLPRGRRILPGRRSECPHSVRPQSGQSELGDDSRKCSRGDTGTHRRLSRPRV